MSGQVCTNPVTGAHYVGKLDPTAVQMRDARRALLAREHFALHGPADALPLPLSHAEREDVKQMGGVHTLVGLFARSLEGLDYDLERHPSLFEYACGVMASEHNGCSMLENDEGLRKRFPPRHLAGLRPGLYWKPRAS